MRATFSVHVHRLLGAKWLELLLARSDPRLVKVVCSSARHAGYAKNVFFFFIIINIFLM